MTFAKFIHLTSIEQSLISSKLLQAYMILYYITTKVHINHAVLASDFLVSSTKCKKESAL